MFSFFRRKKELEKQQQSIIIQSQCALLEAAAATAVAAQDVTKKLKDSLDDSMRQFEGAARILNDALILCGMDGAITSCNPAAGRIFGRQDLLEINICSLFSHKGKSVSPQELWKLIEEGEHMPNLASPLFGVHNDGLEFFIEPTATQLDWSDGTSSMLVLVKSIEPIVQLSNSAKENRENYQNVVKQSFDGIIIEQNDRIMAANPAIVELFGYTVDEILGRPLAALFAAEDHSRVEANDDFAQFEANGLTAESNRLNLIFSSTKINWKGKDARLLTIKDVTQFKRMESITARDNGVDVIVCFDNNLKITFVNKLFARHSNSTYNDLIGRDIRGFVGDQNVDLLTQSLDSLKPESSSERLEMTINGMIFDWINHAIFDDAGNVLEFQSVGRDVTAIINSYISRN